MYTCINYSQKLSNSELKTKKEKCVFDGFNDCKKWLLKKFMVKAW